MAPFRSTAALRPLPLAASVLLASVALAGCGSTVAPGGPAAEPSTAAGPCGAPVAWPSSGAAPHEGWSKDGVRILAVNEVCAEFEVTNPGSEPADAAVLFQWSAGAARSAADPTGTVTAVPAGGTAKGRLALGGAAGTPGTQAAQRPGQDRPLVIPDVRIARVRSVPTAEAPSQGGACPSTGVHVYADRGDAAMGLRAVGVHLVNCGTVPVELDGYPQAQVLDAAHRPVDSVQVLQGGAAIAGATGADAPPQHLTLQPGQGAVSTLVWRNTTDLGSDPVNAPYVRIRATQGAAPVMVTPELDLGTTGRIGVGAWARDGARS
ncbi:DUF4232 domain-containing protein [Streptomyces sp. TLI_171]|uniref:DUF4232 domain-containing protein n=1 Tax=Streptomyces sp. TLI_171 TaxID=1938859 RepID=UPI000C17994C|nr:DUF4232 domain-containing protein [Streptomyces sp. TLI_171]RKE17646.1 uncharacterized protein DUF4232 [Streptomyces sp. TLI_171]